MKTNSEIIFVIHDAEEGGYWAESVGHGIFTQGETLDELKDNIKDAVRLSFDEGEPCPQKIRLHFIRDEVIAL